MADSPFSEDIVKNSHGTLGLVVQDAEETSDESDSDDELLKKGQILVCWYPSGHEETLSINKVQLADRSLLPGDVVKFADSSLSKQKGFVSDVEVIASVKVPVAGQVVRNINCRELHPLQELGVGVHVSLGSWFGLVTESNLKLVLKMKNGSRCCVEGEQAELLYDITDQRDEECPFYSEKFYPGQLVAGPSKVFKDAKWLSGVKPIMHSQSQVKATVEEVTVVSCEVNWQVCGACGPEEENSMFSPPDPTVTGEQLARIKVINDNHHASIQMGDKAFYTVKASDLQLVAQTLGQTSTASKPIVEGQFSKNTSENKPTDSDTTSLLSNDDVKHKGTNQDDSGPAGTLSESTDEDQDGGDHAAPKSKGSSQGSKHDSGSSTSRNAVKRRRKRTKRKRKPMPHMQVNVGDRVCVEVVSTCTTVNVVWQDKTTTTGIPSINLTPVFHLDEHEFFPGDYVNDKRASADSTIYGCVLTCDFDARTCDVKWFTREGLELSTECDVSVYDIAEHTDFIFNSGDIVVRMVPPDYCTSPSSSSATCVGQVLNVDDSGRVSILWVDGTTSCVIPQELYKVDTEDDGHSQDNDDHSNHGNSDDDWETASDESSDEELHDDLVIDTSNEGKDINSADQILPTNRSDEDQSTPDQSTAAADHSEPVDFNMLNDMLSNRNPAFMILENTPDEHHFKLYPYMPQNLRKFMMTIQKELSLLHSSLPSGILVRSFEDRVDLYRVMFAGPVGTPYEHGLFFFDVRLTPNYPITPPQFHYLSMCSGRLNPNLYEDGKVCVSLLGTWTGKGSEVWTPKSSILQVLISIQGLILNSEPYYNEAGYEKQRGTAEGLENSRLYNEMAILKMLQSMARMICNPPFGFDKEIKQHFIEHVPILLRKFDWWLKHKDGLPSATTCPGNITEQQEKSLEEKQANYENNVEKQQLEEIPSEQQQKYDETSSQEANNLVPSEEKPAGEARRVEAEVSQGAVAEASLGAVAADCLNKETFKLPEFPLFPLSKGFQKSLTSCLKQLKDAMITNNLGACLEKDE